MTPGRRDEAVVRRRLAALDEALRHLETHRGTSADDLRQDLDRRWAVLHGLQLCTQAVLDIATHLAAAAGRDPGDYTAAIDALGDLRVLEPAFAKRLRGLAGFRNVLVHEYLDVDREIRTSLQ